MISLRQVLFTVSILTLLLGQISFLQVKTVHACAKGQVLVLNDDGTIDERGTEAAQWVQRARYHLNNDFDYISAIGLFKKALASENADAGYFLGKMYETGMGMNPNLSEGIRYYEMASSLNNPKATIELGVLAVRGRGMPVDYEKALKYFKLAIRQGSNEGQFYIAEMEFNGMGMPAGDPPSVILEFQRLAESGSTNAMTTLGLMYCKGTVVNRDLDRGIKYLNQAAELQDMRALYELFEIRIDHPTIKYMSGYLSDSLKRNANEGDPFAQYMFSKVKRFGLSFWSQDTVEGMRYLELASRQAFRTARWELGRSYELGRLVDKDLDEAFRIYQSGAEIGDGKCMNSLGNFYEEGKGTVVNLAKANEYHEKAIAAGHRPPLVRRTAPAEAAAAIAGSSLAGSSLPGAVTSISSTAIDIAKTAATEAAKSAASEVGNAVGAQVGSFFVNFLGI